MRIRISFFTSLRVPSRRAPSLLVPSLLVSASLVLSLFVLSSPVAAQARQAGEPWVPPPLPESDRAFEELRPALETRIAEHRGIVGLVLLDSNSGERLSVRGNERFPSASIIKIPVLYEIMLRVEEGRLSLDDPLNMLSGDRAPGSGILQHLSAPFTLTVRDAALLMTALSDNTATNLILEKVEPRGVTDRMAAFGLPDTRIFRKVFRDAAESFDPAGSEEWGFGVTTPLDQARLLAWIHRGEAVSPKASREMLRMLDAQTHSVGIPRLLPGGTRVAHKTGSINASRHDCGIVFGPAREYVLCILTRENEDTGWTADNEAEALQADLSRIVFEALNPE